MVRIRANEVSKEIASDKVEQILSGAMQEFLKHGFAGTSMDRVAQAAGVSKATVYNHFQDKEGLFKTLIEQLAQEKFQSAFGTQPLQGEPRIVLRQLIASALQGMSEDEQHQAFVRVLIGESGRFPELAQTWVHHIMKPTIAILCDYMTAHPELDIPDPEATARIMIGALVHFMMTQQILHGKEIIPMESDRMINALTHLMLRGAGL